MPSTCMQAPSRLRDVAVPIAKEKAHSFEWAFSIDED